MSDTVTRIAAAQMDVAFGDVPHNLERVVCRMEEVAARGARLVVFPECVLTGYAFSSVAEAMPFARRAAEAIPSLAVVARRLGLTAVVGTLLPSGCAIRNAAVILTPEADPVVYAKCHLPFLGIDKHAARGESLDVVETPAGLLGMLICYDVRFPEAARTLALRGAEIICVPTNWPQGAETAPEFVTRSRAWENRVFVVACNRVGEERGFPFIGRSQIIGPDGAILAAAAGAEETILTADVDVSLARQKRVIIRENEFEMDLFGDRRPDLYA